MTARHQATAGDLIELRRFERLLRIWSRIDRNERLTPARKGRRRLAACRLVYGDEVDRWPSIVALAKRRNS